MSSAAPSTTSTSSSEAVAQQCGSEVERKSDEYGYDWIIVQRSRSRGSRRDRAHARVGADRQGFRLAAARGDVRFDGGEHPVYWIYGFKRGAFWPFVPAGEATRDNATELELKAKLEHELPIEQDLTRWLALFDAPV